jgi:hypothetical protein
MCTRRDTASNTLLPKPNKHAPHKWTTPPYGSKNQFAPAPSATAQGILTSNMRRKKSKAFDMCFHWMKDRILQQQFHLYWMRGKNNLADYSTKHFLPLYHRLMLYVYLQRPRARLCSAQSLVRGCVTTTAPTGRPTAPTGRPTAPAGHLTAPAGRPLLLTDLTPNPKSNSHPMNNIHLYSS